MRPTRLGTLALIALIAAAAGWGIAEIVRGQSGRVMSVPWTAAATIWLLAVAVLLWAVLSRPRLQRHPGAKPMAPVVAARTAALAMAASRTGALVAGGYAGLALGALPARDTPAGSAALWASAATALGALALAASAVWLERLCRLRDGDDQGLAARLGSPP